MDNVIKIGCIADDFTGASDAASFIKKGGLNTILINGIPESDFSLPDECEAVVIALKSRTQNPKEAVEDSLSAINWLKEKGTKHYYFKYCSTFDSTDKGNIGPVADAIMNLLGVNQTILCPALPANGRTVSNGILYVNGVPLEESSMRNHPLTPMKKSRIADLIEPQSRYAAVELFQSDFLEGKEHVKQKLAEYTDKKETFYVIPDYVTEDDAKTIVDYFGGYRFLTGGSGILCEWARSLSDRDSAKLTFPGIKGKAILVAGSCSEATRAQELWFEKNGGPSVRLTDEGILDGTETANAIWEKIESNDMHAPLIYTYDTPDGLEKKRNSYGRSLAAKLEDTLSDIAGIALNKGYSRIISAGGETSGAVTGKLGFKSFWIGESIAPGVPVLIPVDDTAIRLVLKSGNFGQEDFFGRALKVTGEE